MNKPAKLLVAVTVLAFAAAGLYYAWLAPAKKVAPTPTVKLTRQDQEGPKAPADTSGTDLRQSSTMPADAMPTPVPATAAPAGVPSGAFADPKPSANVPGFVAVNEPIKPLPADGLPGFTPVAGASSAVITTGPASRGAGANAPTTAPVTNGAPASTPPVVVPATPSTPSSTAAPATAATAPKPAAGAGSSGLPALPAPGKPAVPPASVTSGSSAVVTPAVPATPATKSTRAETYTVKEGDSIAGIWRSLTGNERGWEKLLAANPGVDASRLKIGQVLKVPDVATTSTPATAQGTSTATVSKTVAGNSYTIESGDTLHRIANKVYGDSRLWNLIYDANKAAIGPDPAALKVGTRLQIPAKPGAPSRSDGKGEKPEAKEPAKAAATSGAASPSAPR